MARTQSTPKTTEKPSDTGAGARTNREAERRVASKPGVDGHAPINTDMEEPGAPDPTSDRPDRGPSGAATEARFHGQKAKKD